MRSSSSEAHGREAGVRSEDLQIVRYPEVEKMTSLSRTTLWRLQRQGKFPKPFAVTENLKGWLRSDIVAWIQDKAR